MMINYYLTPDKLINSQPEENQDGSLASGDQRAPRMVSYLCHIPGKLSFTVTATSIRLSHTVHISKMP